MLGNYYHEILRKTIIPLVLFLMILKYVIEMVKRKSEMRVPLAYDLCKILARLEQQADLNRAIQITFPNVMKLLILLMMQQENLE